MPNEEEVFEFMHSISKNVRITQANAIASIMNKFEIEHKDATLFLTNWRISIMKRRCENCDE